MANIIAVTGKGGTGKTTLTGLLIDYLAKTGRRPILVVDADANSNLNEVLGVEVKTTLGELRETVMRADLDPANPIPAAMSKQEYLDGRFAEALFEEDDYDMLVMGRTQGTGCYCFVNGLLKTQIQKYSGGYKYMVVDNEAGMEHISRGVLPTVDIILLVSDPSRRGIQAAARIRDLVDEIGLNPQAVRLIVNKAPEGRLDEGTREEIEKHGLALAGVVPADPLIYEYDCAGKPTVTLPEDAAARKAFDAILDEIIPK
ncbi:MAG: AAA family ATPase [Clostridiales Family XIII bacterium]|jgi:CO dehydrogenase maturation factor|nr:AAA family ATPase [Clostridiales Family XIII bacterium]